jgi:LCP family protein required for cell wall assembly
MAPDEKPYRVYRGGRQKGKVPVASARSRPKPPRKQRGAAAAGAGVKGPSTRKRSFLRRVPWRVVVPLVLVLILVLVVVWGVTSYLAVASGMSDANKRLAPSARAALTKQNGLLLTHATTILVLGTDNADQPGRTADDHSDSMQLVRTDPQHHRLYYLSIPRDMVVQIPGVGTEKINAAMQVGGPKLAIETVHDYTGLPIDHVVVVNFAEFSKLIDAIGGITIDVPEKILSDKFDCPYSAAKCASWKGWRFAKGVQHMNGQRALTYSRIRVNQLNPSESDFTRQGRQQAVTQAVMSKLTSVGTLFTMPFDGKSYVKPLATDLTAWQLIQLGWVKFRSSNSSVVHCRLGADLGGGGSGTPSDQNPTTIQMFLGKSAPQPPTGAYAPGCVVGSKRSLT